MAGNVSVEKSLKKRMRRQKRLEGQAADLAPRYGYTQREWIRLNEQDRLQQRRNIRLGLVLALLLCMVLALLYGVWYVMLRSHDYELPLRYDRNSAVYGFSGSLAYEDVSKPFSADLAVTDTDVGTQIFYSNALSAGLFDLEERNVLYGKDMFTRRSPASLTKMMTALVALKYGNPDDQVIVTDTAKDIEYGSSVCDIKTGDTLSLKQLLYGMMIASGNDAAMMVAEHVGGSVPAFIEMMNAEALRIGATRTHFDNPHGLTSEEHYTCIYDLYLMFHEAMKNDMFMDIISRKNYYAEYKNAEGNPVAVTWESTNHYFTGEASAPEGVNVYGGKTGTTEDAGGCLTLLAKDMYGKPYLGVILHSSDRNTVYDDMNELLGLVGSEGSAGSVIAS